MDVFGQGARDVPARCRRGRSLAAFLCVLAVGSGASRLEAAITVSLVASPPPPAPVGTMITWTAQASNAGSSDLWYRFSVRGPDGTSRVIRDYGPLSTLEWTSIEEGVYELEVSVRDRGTQEIAQAQAALELDSRAQNGQTSVSPTSHPLVFLFSSPECASGQARVQFQSPTGSEQFTPYKPCVIGRSLNFYLAGLAPTSSYSARLETRLDQGSSLGPAVSFQTGGAPPGLPPLSVIQAPAAPVSQGVLVQAPLYLPAVATDLNGNLLWYGPADLTYVTRPGPDATFFGLVELGIDPARDVVRRFDLVGMTVQETNVARVNEQLAALGKRQISGFHHDGRTLTDGKIVVLGNVEQILTDVQGPGPLDVIGDMILVLDADLQVVWTWDTFDHMDPSRAALLGEKCLTSPGCAPHYLSPDANDWTHGNSVSETPDGNLLFSSRHQDWLLKVDYRNGAGNGDVIWRLGKDGDFTFDSTDPYPWFSHQHDAGYEPESRSTITLFDNGNTRLSAAPGSSRGQAIEVDEEHRIVRPVLNVDLGVVSAALGSAQRLDDGTYHFDAGFVHDTTANLNARAFSLQIDPSGDRIVSSITLPTPVYRSFRVADLYGRTSAGPRPTTRVVAFR